MKKLFLFLMTLSSITISTAIAGNIEITVRLKKGDIIYTFTDGYADQFGGPKGKKFKYKQLVETIQHANLLHINEQEQKFNNDNSTSIDFNLSSLKNDIYFILIQYNLIGYFI